MCDRCQRGYHVECLGPFYPTEPEGEDDVWVSKIINVALFKAATVIATPC